MKLSLQNYRDGATVWLKFHNPIFSRFWDIGSSKAENRQFCLPWPWNPG